MSSCGVSTDKSYIGWLFVCNQDIRSSFEVFPLCFVVLFSSLSRIFFKPVSKIVAQPLSSLLVTESQQIKIYMILMSVFLFQIFFSWHKCMSSLLSQMTTVLYVTVCVIFYFVEWLFAIKIPMKPLLANWYKNISIYWISNFPESVL